MRILSVDGGGTKLNAVLTDENMNLLGSGSSGGVNPNQLPAETAREHVADCLRQVFSEEKPAFIDRVYVIFVGDIDIFKAQLESFAAVGSYTVLSEAWGGLLAGALSENGLLALSGTGSAVYCISGEKYVRSGGWGPILGDSGGGVWIGHMALRAAIRELDGWGAPTALTPMILREWGAANDTWELVRIVHGGTPYSRIASLTRIVGRAAEEGDETALEIIREAGSLMAEQMLGLLKRLGFTDSGPEITLCGGAWKVHPEMRLTFARRIRETFPGAQVRPPLFEHVCAGQVLFMLENGAEKEEILRTLTEKAPGYRVDIN